MQRYYSEAPEAAAPESQVKVVRRGIASIVTYVDKRGSKDAYAERQRFVWPNSLHSDSKYISKRVMGRVV